jgi:hypothetical protein
MKIYIILAIFDVLILVAYPIVFVFNRVHRLFKIKR